MPERMRVIASLLLTFVSLGLGAQTAPELAAPDLAALSEVGRQMRAIAELPTPPPVAELDRFYLVSHQIQELLLDPAHKQIIQDELSRELGPEALAWWNERIDGIIRKWARAKPEFARGLKKLNVELVDEPTRWNRWLSRVKSTMFYVVTVPIYIFGVYETGVIDTNLAKKTESLPTDPERRRVLSLLEFRERIKTAFANSCAGGLSPTAPNP